MNNKLVQSNLDKTADDFIRWIGSFSSLVVHTLLFISAFIAGILWGYWDTILLVLTTIVSLEAIYLAIFIQMSINKNTASLQAVKADIGEIQEDVEDIAEDVDELQEDVGELNEDDAAEETQDEIDRRLLKEIQENMARISIDLDQLKKSRA